MKPSRDSDSKSSSVLRDTSEGWEIGGSADGLVVASVEARGGGAWKVDVVE